MSINGENIRNIAVVGHSGEGKTTLCEAMLFNGGVIDRMGKVTDGTTVSDFDDLEKAKNRARVILTKAEGENKAKYDAYCALLKAESVEEILSIIEVANIPDIAKLRFKETLS